MLLFKKKAGSSILVQTKHSGLDGSHFQDYIGKEWSILVVSALSPLLASSDQANCYAREIYMARSWALLPADIQQGSKSSCDG